MTKRTRQTKQEKRVHAGADVNTLTLDIIRMIKTLIQFDLLTVTNQRDQLSVLIPMLILMLEYDRSNIVLPYILHLIREEKVRKSQESQNKLVSTMKAAISGAVAGVADIGKFVASSIMRKHGQDALEEEFAEYQTTILSKNPIISSLISITNLIQTYQTEFEEMNSQ
jgi:hypothetical protein